MHLQIIVSNEKDFTYIKQVPHMAILANWREFKMMTCNIEIKKNMHQLYIDSVKYVNVGNF